MSKWIKRLIGNAIWWTVALYVFVRWLLDDDYLNKH